MIKLNEQNELNDPREYDKIFLKRKENGVDKQDLRRWKRLLKHYKGSRLIDLGCLDSEIPGLVSQRFPGAEVWGIDLAPQTITEMQRKFPWVFYEVQDVYHTKYPNDYFGYAVAGEIMEHLEDPEKFIAEAMRILRPGGILAISVPKEEAREPGAVDKDRHLWSYDTKDFETLLGSYGTVTVETMGSKFLPFYEYHFPNIISFCKKK